MRSAEGTAEVGNVTLYFPEVEFLFATRQALLHGALVDVVELDPFEDILRCIPQYHNDGVSRAVDNFPVPTQ